MRVILSPHAQRDIRRLSRDVAERVIIALRRLREDPRPPGCRLLRDHRPPTWRVLYEIDDGAGIVTVTGVGHRAKAY